MCVVAVAIGAHPEWRLIAIGNRDEYHSRATEPLHVWDDGSGMIAGRDLVSGGSWMGVSAAGRFAVVTNIRNADGPDPGKLSRGALVADWLTEGKLPTNLEAFNPFNLVVAGSGEARHLANRPKPHSMKLENGIHGLSNAVPDEHWPRKERLTSAMAEWLAKDASELSMLLDLLLDEDLPDRQSYPIFIRNAVYGTRSSTVIAVDASGHGSIIERRFGADGSTEGQTALEFRWPDQHGDEPTERAALR